MSQRRLQLAVGLVLFALAVVVSPASAGQPECRVENLRPETLFYNSSTHADPLGTAIAEAAAGDTLQVIGTCRGNHFYVDKDLTLTGRKSDQHEDTIAGGTSAPLLYIGTDVHATFSDLHITGGKYSGIAIFQGALTVKNSTVSGVTDGRGIESQYDATVIIDNTNVSDNGGGGIFNYSGSMTVTDSIVSGNTNPGGHITTTGDGGGIYNYGGDLIVSGSDVSGNTATHNGGGIYNSGTLTIENSQVVNNSASQWGGGVYSTHQGTLTIDHSIVSDNTSSGIHTYGTATIEDSTVSENSGIGIWSNGPLVIHGSVIEGNSGTGIWNAGVQLTLDQTIVRDNHYANGAGGGISNNYGSVTLTDSLVTGNSAYSAGGIYAKGNMTLTDSSVTSNVATGPGGGIGITMGTTTLNDSTVSGNTATLGGGIWKTTTPVLVLNGSSSVTGNTPDDIYTSP